MIVLIEIGGNMATQEQTFTVTGLDCAVCARTAEGGVAQIEGVQRSELNFTTGTLRVQGSASREQVIRRIRDLGFDVVEPDATTAQARPAVAPQPQGFLAYMAQRTETRLALVAALLLIPGLVEHELLGRETGWIDLPALLALVLTIGPVALSAWRALKVNRELNINALMTIAAVGAVVIGAYFEAAMVLVLFTLGEALEGYTATRARNAIRSLMDLAPEMALRLHNNKERRVPVAELVPGDLILVRPGERIPMDGRIRAGASSINQAPITGESALIEKTPGAEVFAGSINGEGSLELEVIRPAAESTISRMIRLVEEAQERRAPVQRLVDRFAKYYTPLVVLVALLTTTIPPLFFGQPFWNPAPTEFGWLYRGLALLVVACPCALVISTPVSIISAMTSAARYGVLFKGGAYVEALSKVRAVAFDKTGTLTSGRPSVVGLRTPECAGSDADGNLCRACGDMLALAHAVERRSEHPLAYAITSASTKHGLDQCYPPAEAVTALTGRGVSGRVGDREVLVGSHRYFDADVPHSPQHCAAAAQDAVQGYTPLLVSSGGTYLGTITVADTVRPGAREAVAQLNDLGLAATIMLTGDQRSTAERIGADVGVSAVRAELLPEQKVTAVAELQREYGPIAMIGDGINDTPALATASIGIAVGAAHGGTNQAMETADITLMSDDLRRLPFALRLSRAAMSTVKFNVFLSIAIKLVVLLLVLAGTGTMWMAVLADVGTSLLVTLNGMRLLGVRAQSAERKAA
jgi:Cd2+/Zn2+-exporting ATPase